MNNIHRTVPAVWGLYILFILSYVFLTGICDTSLSGGWVGGARHDAHTNQKDDDDEYY